MRYFFVVAVALLMAASPVPAQVAGKGYDTSLPIEINADSLKVQQDANIAIFRGNVDAVQGELNLRAAQLTVHYKASAEGENAIRVIEAVGNVFLSSPEEMARGEKAVYDVEAETVELFGSVILTRGNNVTRGEYLKISLATGTSRMLDRGGEIGPGDFNEIDGEEHMALYPKAGT